jgi:small subunit ribosomal protein S1
MQHDYEAYAVGHPVGAPVRGRVRAVAAFGVFVELAPNVQGLLEIPDFAAGVPVRFPDDYPQVGTSVEAIIKFFDVPTMNIRLTQRPASGAAKPGAGADRAGG